MLSTLSSNLLSAALLFETVTASYKLHEDWSGNNFFNNFAYFDATSPTGGPDYSADYVNKATAEAHQLTQVEANGNVRINVNTQGTVSNQRETIRLESNNAFENNLIILDVDHVPFGCGAWPAYWFLGSNPWPYNGEIDVIENVNFNRNGRYTLHTDENCYTSGFDHSIMTGSVENTPGTSNGGWCNSVNGYNGNSGCGVQSDEEDFGIGFNEQGGGVVAIEMFLTEEPKWIKIWSFPRDKGVPSDIESGNPNPLTWGKPRAWFPLESNCPNSMGHPQHIIINTELCGEWAGNTLPSQCASQYGVDKSVWGCHEIVKNHPEAFVDAYWDIKSIKIYDFEGDYMSQQGYVPNPNKDGPSPSPSPSGTQVCAPNTETGLSGAVSWAINDSGLDVTSGMPAECANNEVAKATYVFGKYYEQAKVNNGDCSFGGVASLQDAAGLDYPNCAYPKVATQSCVPKSGTSDDALWDAYGWIGTQGVDLSAAPSGCTTAEQKATFAMSAYYAKNGSCTFNLSKCNNCAELTDSPAQSQCVYGSSQLLGAQDPAQEEPCEENPESVLRGVKKGPKGPKGPKRGPKGKGPKRGPQ